IMEHKNLALNIAPYKQIGYWLLLTSLILLGTTVKTQAQQKIRLQGTVLSVDDQEPLPGVSINADGKTIGVSGASGDFSVEALPGESLTFIYIGFNPYHLKVTSPESNLQITMQPSNTD